LEKIFSAYSKKRTGVKGITIFQTSLLIHGVAPSYSEPENGKSPAASKYLRENIFQDFFDWQGSCQNGGGMVCHFGKEDGFVKNGR
jgi:hypothetical protein